MHWQGGRGGEGQRVMEAAEPAAPLPYVVLLCSNDGHAHRLYRTLALSANRPSYACLRDRLACERVLRPYPDAVLLCGLRQPASQQDFLALLSSTHLGSYIFRVFFCSDATPDPARVAAAFDAEASGAVMRLQGYPRTAEAELSKLIPMSVDLRMSGFGVIGSVVKLPAEQLQPAVGDRNEPWRKRRKIKRASPKKKKKKKKQKEETEPAQGGAEGGAAPAEGQDAAAGGGDDEEAPDGWIKEADLSTLESAGEGEGGVLYLHGVCSAESFYRHGGAEQSRTEKNADRISRAAHKLTEVIYGCATLPSNLSARMLMASRLRLQAWGAG